MKIPPWLYRGGSWSLSNLNRLRSYWRGHMFIWRLSQNFRINMGHWSNTNKIPTMLLMTHCLRCSDTRLMSLKENANRSDMRIWGYCWAMGIINLSSRTNISLKQWSTSWPKFFVKISRPPNTTKLRSNSTESSGQTLLIWLKGGIKRIRCIKSSLFSSNLNMMGHHRQSWSYRAGWISKKRIITLCR